MKTEEIQNEGQTKDGLDRLLFPKRTLVHVGGMPFWLEEPAILLGKAGNVPLASGERVKFETVAPNIGNA